MLGQKHRFHGYGSLRTVYQRGQTVRGQAINLRYLKHRDQKPYRVAVIVSRKVSKSAVVRNRIRRRINEIIRQSEITIAPGTDLALTVFSDTVASMEAAKLKSAVESLLRKTAD